VRIPALYMDDVEQHYATYIIIYFVSCLPDDYFILSRTLLHYTIQYTKRVLTDSCYLSVVF